MSKLLLRFVVEYKVIVVMNIFQRSLQVLAENSAPATPVAKKNRFFFGNKGVTDLGGTPLPPFSNISPKNFLKKGLKIVFFAQKTPDFGLKIGYGIWGYPPPPFTEKISAKRGLWIWGVPPLLYGQNPKSSILHRPLPN